MATQVAPLQRVKLASGPAPLTAEQRHWSSFKNQLLIPSPTTYPVTHISHAPSLDTFAVTTGTRVQLFSARTRKLQKTITRFSDVARSGEVRRDGRVLVAGDDSGTVQVFDTGSRAILRTWKTHKQPVWATRWSDTDLTSVLSASDDKTVRLWDLPSNDPVRTFVGHGDYVRTANFMPGTMSNMVVSGSYDSTVKLWDPRTGRDSAVMTFKHAAPVEDVLSMPSGTTVLAAAGNSVSVLDLVAGKPLRMITNHQKTVMSMSLASEGRRLVTGGLEGHVKVFETTGWNVVYTKKYQSPVLSVKVIPDSDGVSDKHLAVGMQSGVMSVVTRMSAAAAAKEKQREREMQALLGGTIDELDKKTRKRKRRIEGEAELEKLGEGADVIIANDATRRKKEQAWQRDLRNGRYAQALDAVLDRSHPSYTPANILTLLTALRHRSAIRSALANRDEETVMPVLKWASSHVQDPRHASAAVEVALHLLDLYGEYAGESEELAQGFGRLSKSVRSEAEKRQVARMTGGMLESLLVGLS